MSNLLGTLGSDWTSKDSGAPAPMALLGLAHVTALELLCL
jgi:hypothetical protein